MHSVFLKLGLTVGEAFLRFLADAVHLTCQAIC